MLSGQLQVTHSPGLQPDAQWLNGLAGGQNQSYQYGITAAGTCVVAARVMVLPLTATVRAPLFRPLPKLTATAYDALPNSNAEACKASLRARMLQIISEPAPVAEMQRRRVA